MNDRPTVAIGVVVFKEKNVLLIQRGKEPNKGAWSIPGGKQEAGETVTTCAHREILEETSVPIKDLTLLDCLDLMEHDDRGAVTRHYTLIDYYAFAADDTAPKADSDVIGAEFVPLQEAVDRVTWSETKRIITLAAEKAGLLHDR